MTPSDNYAEIQRLKERVLKLESDIEWLVETVTAREALDEAAKEPG